MSRKCTVCAHPELEAIDKMLATGRIPIRHISSLYGVSYSALRRHKQTGHIAKKMVQAVERRKQVEAQDLLVEIDNLKQYSLLVLSQAMQQKTHSITLAACRETRHTLKLLVDMEDTARELAEAERRRQAETERLAVQRYESPRIREVVFLHRIEDPRVQTYDEDSGMFSVAVSRQAWGEFQSWERRSGLAAPGIPVPPRVADYGEGGNGHGDQTAVDAAAQGPGDTPGPDAGRPDAARKGRGESAGGHRQDGERLDEGGQKPQYHEPFFQERPPSSE